jgi:hypothetical protein
MGQLNQPPHRSGPLSRFMPDPFAQKNGAEWEGPGTMVVGGDSGKFLSYTGSTPRARSGFGGICRRLSAFFVAGNGHVMGRLGGPKGSGALLLVASLILGPFKMPRSGLGGGGWEGLLNPSLGAPHPPPFLGRRHIRQMGENVRRKGEGTDTRRPTGCNKTFSRPKSLWM